MFKKLLFGAVILITVITLAGCGASNGGTGENDGTNETADKGGNKASGMEAVCEYFPKELIEEAIGRPIVKVEDSSMAEDYICIYYTDYSETYSHTPYGDKPGGPHIVVVLEDEAVDASWADLEKYGYTYTKDESYAVDNRLISSRGQDVYRADLIVNENRFFRISSNHFAVNADETIKIGRRFAERMKNEIK